ncbi:MAG TPA: phage portal protein [Bryobacteraceae bacterium]|nr:phage portal protein [Bryobacteraceae bacterium]
MEKPRYRVAAVSQRISSPAVVKGNGNMTMEGWIAADWGWNYWQSGHNPVPTGMSAIVEACISSYAQTIAMCPGAHWRLRDDGGRDRISNSALSRVLREPNSYQTISDFLLNLTQSLYSDGNAYALALRNSRFEISELHLMHPRMCRARAAETGDVFYTLGGNDIVQRMIGGAGVEETVLGFVPARDVLHVKLKTRAGYPLRGESPMLSAALDEAASSAMARQAVAFYMNQSRPSGTLNTDLVLTKEQVEELRNRWNEQSQGLNAGGTPILTAGLKWNPMTSSARDSQLADIMGYTDKRIASVYRVPLPLLNLVDGGPQGSTEALMQFWVATGLGFAINHIEDAFGKTFGLFGLPDEYLEFDTAALLRSSFKERTEGWAAGVIGGIFAPNDARAEFELPNAKFGDEPRVQQQVVPLSFWGQNPPKAPAAPQAPAISPPPPASDKELADDNERLRQSFRASHARHVTV